MKTILNIRIIAMIIILSFAFVNYSVAQSDWNTHGNIADSSSYLGNSNYKDLRFKTDSTTQMTITKDGDVNINNNLNVGGSITTDSLGIVLCLCSSD